MNYQLVWYAISLRYLARMIAHCYSLFQVQCYSSAAGGDSVDGSTLADFCNEEGAWGKSQDCILQNCSVLDRLCASFLRPECRFWRLTNVGINEVQYQACDKPIQTREKRFYYLLAAEIPTWICPWLRLFSSWRSSEGVRGDDYVMSACWVCQ